MPSTGWITSHALRQGGTGNEDFQLTETAQIADGIITAAKLARGAAAAGYYGLNAYGDSAYG